MRNNYSRVPDDFSSFKSPSGDLFHDVLSSTFRPDGTIELKVIDRVDIKKEINSHRDETDMSFILSRLMAGDDSVLNPNPPMYGDFSKFPKSYVEMLNMVLDGERYFDSLPLEIRKQFDNDRAKWFASIGSESWMSAMGFVRPEDQAVAADAPDARIEADVSDARIEKDVIE